MQKYKNITNLVGNTPLIQLKKASEITGCNILAKAEYLNPGQSIKDRAALYMIKNAKENKKLIVEGTGGNTGIGLTVIGNALGYKTKIVMPDNQSIEKINLLKYLGAKVILTKQLPFTNPNNYIQLARRIAEEENAIWTNQFDNLANREAHIKTTSQEIWSQTNGTIDAFICSVGTGGTLAGNFIGLKEKNKNIKVFCADPYGSGMYSWIRKGLAKATLSSITEGIGQSRITKNLEGINFDGAFKIHDKTALKIVYELIRSEGLLVGPTSGINVGGAIKLAKYLGPNKTIVTVLCDGAERYKSKIFNEKFLQEKNLNYNELSKQLI